MNCALHAPNLPQPKVVSVNGTVIAREAIAREVQHHPASKPIAAWQAAARALVVRELLLQEARRLGLTAEPRTDADGRRETEEEALIRAVHEREVTPEPDIETCRRYYEQNRRAFRSAPLYEAAHILFAARRDQPAAFAQAREIANTVLAELAQAPHRFGEFAKLHSACPSASHGGNLGQIGEGQTTPEFERALTALAPGEMSREPIETRYGLHIIRLDRKIEGRELPFELVADRIADYLRESVMRRASAQYLARLVSRADITGIVLAGAGEHRVN
jgi:peptidyl-prolyl cis-trans isomerase C